MYTHEVTTYQVICVAKDQCIYEKTTTMYTQTTFSATPIKKRLYTFSIVLASLSLGAGGQKHLVKSNNLSCKQNIMNILKSNQEWLGIELLLLSGRMAAGRQLAPIDHCKSAIVYSFSLVFPISRRESQSTQIKF